MSDYFEARLDILDKLYSRNLINIIGAILDDLSGACLCSLRCASRKCREIVDSDKTSVQRIYKARRWRSGEPVVDPVSLQPGHMVTSLSSRGERIMFGLLGADATVNIHSKDTLRMESRLVQSHEFPASISGLDYNEKLIVTCAYESMNGAGLSHAVYIWMIDDKRLASKISPHSEMIRAIRLTTKYLLTGSNDGTIAVTDLTNPDQPKLVHRLKDHKDYISSIDCDARNLVSVSADNVLKVWSLIDFKCNFSAKITSPTLKVALSWPLAATGGHTVVILWNVERSYPVCFLPMNTIGSLSSLAMTFRPSSESMVQNGAKSKEVSAVNKNKMAAVHIAAGDNQGFICIWDTSAIIAGHPAQTPHRIIQIGNGGNMISALSVDDTRIITADWAGQVLSWNFG